MLQGEIRGLERTRESMARELVSLSNQNTELEERLEEFPTLQARLQEVEGRYNALLQMYGEKVEEADELKMDLQDVKDMYKAQVTYPQCHVQGPGNGPSMSTMKHFLNLYHM